MQTVDLFEALGRLLAEGKRLVVATVVEASGSSPQKGGARLVLVEDGTLLGTIGGGAVEQQIVEAARALLENPAAPATRLLTTNLTRDLGMCCGGTMSVFLERHAPAEVLWLFGAGHVHRALAAAAVEVGFTVRVVDSREEWLTGARFPRAKLLLEDPAVAARREALAPIDFVAIATHDHALDEEVLVAIGERPLRFLGLIGSARKAVRFRERLALRGLSPAAVARLQCPMGLDIGAQSPEEIAVAVVAELVRVRAAMRARQSGPRALERQG
jgi:xanthine dehydrogenase accessory factor